MNAQANVVPKATSAKIAPTLSEELTVLRPELEKVLPAHVSSDKFLRVVNTSISMNPDLYRADRRSLFTSCVKCATDGLVPDGREAALVIFNTKEKWTDETGKKQEKWVKKVQYMPMVYGIQKKIRNSGELLSLTCNVVFEKDDFNYWIDDTGEHITHRPNVDEPDRGGFKCVYAIAKTKDGGVYTEVMTRGQIEQVRGISKSSNNGPWVDWFDEMARKTVIRRLSKRLPMSTDIERVITRDDEFYQVNGRRIDSSSGTEAAKALLGISSQAPAIESVAGPDETDPDDQPIYDLDSGLNSLREAGDLQSLNEAWDSIVADFDATKRPLPVDIEALYGDRKAAFEKF